MLGEHLAVQFEDGLKICEVITQDEAVECVIFTQYTLDIDCNLSLWQSLDSSSTYVKKQSVLPVRPQVEVVPSLSKRTRSGRKIVLQVENIDVIASMAKT